MTTKAMKGMDLEGECPEGYEDYSSLFEVSKEDLELDASKDWDDWVNSREEDVEFREEGFHTRMSRGAKERIRDLFEQYGPPEGGGGR